MKILRRIENDVVVNFNYVIRIVYCALNIEVAQPVAIQTFKWTLYVTKTNTIRFYIVVIKMHGLKDSSSIMIIIL